MIIEIIIKKLTPELSIDYFDFFETRAFTDESPYRCYCQMYQMSKEQQKEEMDNFKGDDYGLLAKTIAEKQIKSGVLRGYLAYMEGKSVGWCNANDRANFPSDPCSDVLFHSTTPQCEIAVVCFEIAPDYRGRGIATALLNRVILDAKAKGFSSVVGFPMKRNERYEGDCTGPFRLYENAEFQKISEYGDVVIMKKEFLYGHIMNIKLREDKTRKI
jgi:GNAT superfamily N-acetyltransferase